MARQPAGYQYTQAEIDDVLTAVIAHAGCISPAVRWLKANGKPTPAPPTVQKWVRIDYLERHEELRERLAGIRESQLANDYLDASVDALEATQLAVSKARERLKAGNDEDPAKSAASLGRVSQMMIEKRFMLQSRPTKISETRDAEEIVRKLVAMKVLHLPDQLEAGEGE